MTRLALAMLLISAAPISAETFSAPSLVTKVTLYPSGASVERVVKLDLPAGAHEIVIPDLPLNTYAEALDVKAPATLALGAVSLLTDRLPTSDLAPGTQIIAAKEALKAAEAALRASDTQIAGIRARAEAAREQIDALRSLTKTDNPPATPEALKALAATVGSETLAALQVAQAAEAEAVEAEVAREDVATAVTDAKAALDALTTGEVDHATLTLAVDSTGGPVELTIVTITDQASWAPAYDFRLTTEPATLDVDRAVTISQYSGEDWSNVALVLSTASPFSQNTPSGIYPDLRRIYPQQEPGDGGNLKMSSSDEGGAVIVMEEPAPVVAEAASASMLVNWQGATVTYAYPKPASIRDGSDQLRLPLDRIALTPDVFVLAVPMTNDRGFVMAEVTNTGAEPLLPGTARYYRDGALVGGGEVGLLASGDKVELGFGKLDSLIVTREVPMRNEGDRGVFVTATERTETAVIKIDNFTNRAWPMRVRDRVPYSEQEDLEILYTATPAETLKEKDGQRGLLEWQIDLAAGASTQITLEHALRWPEGMVLQ
jgi:uncharacterized protein (TIGR02231 family)